MRRRLRVESKKVLVAGCGGLGCYEIELLARLGVGEIVAVDGDRFSKGNMNRQLYCTGETIGLMKAEVAASRWPGRVTAVCSFIGAENGAALLAGCDVVIDALDSVPARRTLAAVCEKAGVPLVHGAIGDTNAQCCVILPGDKDILDILYPGGAAEKIPTVSYTPALCASMQIALAAKLLKGEEPERRTVYVSDLDCMEFEKIHL